MRTILVSAVEESAGKTAVALGLATIGRDRGHRVGYMKPKGTRLESREGRTVDTDPLLARELLDLDFDLEDLEPVVYSPTFVDRVMRGEVDPDEVRASVRDRFEAVSADRDVMVVEGGSVVSTGGAVDLADPALARLLDADVLLVADYERPEDIDGLLAAVDSVGDSLAGVVFNGLGATVRETVESDVRSFLDARGVPVVGTLPRVRELAGVTVAALADELDATIAGDAPTDAYVERFLVGAMGPEASLRAFRRTSDAAVVTGGDRPEILTVALEAPGVRCLVLTGGTRPSSAVVGKADERSVPILVVETDTTATVERIESIIRSGRTRDERTVERMRELLCDHADVERILAGE